MVPQFSKSEKILASVVVAVIVVFFGFFAVINKSSKSKFTIESETAINYKMARPEQAYSEYTLEGRELDQVYEGLAPEEKKALEKNKKDLAKVKKKEEIKKKQADVQRIQAQQKLIAQKAQQFAKQTQLQKELLKKRSQNLLENSAQVASEITYGAQLVNNAGTLTTEDAERAKGKKTFAEWRAVLFENPTTENLTLFINAYRSSELTSTEYQSMAQDLIEQEDNKLKGLGLAMLRSVPSLESLSQLVHAEPALPASYQSYVEQSYVAYFYPQNLSYMKSALQTQDRVLQVKVLTLLQSNLSRLSAGDQTVFVDSRHVRSGEVNRLTMSSFNSLLPTLTTLSSNIEQAEVSSLAQEVSSIIQSYNNVAQN